MSREARQIKPRIKISAAVYGHWESCRQSIGQDWKAWVEAGYLDFVCPMDYDGDDGKFAVLVCKQAGWVHHKIPLYPGIGAHKLSGPEQLARQIQLTRDLGADGFVVFNLTEKLATEFLPPLLLKLSFSPRRPATADARSGRESARTPSRPPAGRFPSPSYRFPPAFPGSPTRTPGKSPVTFARLLSRTAPTRSRCKASATDRGRGATGRRRRICLREDPPCVQTL